MKTIKGYHGEWNMGTPGGWDYQVTAQRLGRMAWDLIRENTGKGGRVHTRHMFLPALDRLTEVRGLKRSRLDSRLSGLVGPTLLEIGPRTKAVTLAMEPCGKTVCLCSRQARVFCFQCYPWRKH